MITRSHFLQKHAQNPLVKGDSLKAVTLLVISLLQERVEMEGVRCSPTPSSLVKSVSNRPMS